jgi:hypothetical protein
MQNPKHNPRSDPTDTTLAGEPQRERDGEPAEKDSEIIILEGHPDLRNSRP